MNTAVYIKIQYMFKHAHKTNVSNTFYELNLLKKKCRIFHLDDKEKSSIAVAMVYFYFEVSIKNNSLFKPIQLVRGIIC